MRDWRNKTILIAEDDSINYNLLNIILRQTGARVVWAQNGLEAFNIYVKEKETIDAILMDIQMPVMDGHESSYKIRQLSPDVPIIVISAYTSAEVKSKAAEVGTNEFLNKPVNAGILLETIEKFFNLRQ